MERKEKQKRRKYVKPEITHTELLEGIASTCVSTINNPKDIIPCEPATS